MTEQGHYRTDYYPTMAFYRKYMTFWNIVLFCVLLFDILTQTVSAQSIRRGRVVDNLLREEDILRINNGVEVPFGRSTYLDPEKDLKISVFPGDNCVVTVIDNEPVSQRPGRITPPVFPCEFGEREVKYSHFGARNPPQDRIKLQIRYDSNTDTIIIPLTITARLVFVQLEVIVRNTPLTVHKLLGVSNPISATVLELDYDRENQICKISVLSRASGLPNYGIVMNDTSTLSMVDCDEFLTLGVRYKHTARTDSPDRDFIPMVVEVMDKDGSMEKQEYFQIMVRIKEGAENTKPFLNFNSLLIMDVNQFVMTAITPDILWAEDTETAPDKIVFNITSPLGEGEGSIVSTDDRNQPVTSFYQKEIREIKIAYKPPSEDSDTQRIFQVEFQAVDAEGLTSDPFKFTIVVKPMNTLAPVVTKNTGIQLFEGQTRTLSSQKNLRISDEDNLDGVRIQVVDGLRYGQLLVDGQRRKFFTPADLDAEIVEYKHDGSDTTSDNIIFRMSDGKNLVEFLFPVTIYPDDDQPPVLNVNTGLEIRKGQFAEISLFVLGATDIDSDDSTIRFVLEAPYSTEGDVVKRQFEIPDDPRNWRLEEGVYEKSINEFSQEDIIEGKVFYKHVGPHHSDFVIDHLKFRVADGGDPPNKSKLHQLLVKIAPVDDQPPYLYQNTPLTMKVEEFKLTNVRRRILRFTDDDTDDRKLKYIITQNPYDTDPNTPLPAGNIVLCDYPDSEITAFTQAHVNHHKVCYHPPGRELGITPRVIQFDFDVHDTSGNVLPNNRMTIFLEPVNNKPPVVTNKGASMFENGYMVLSPYMIDAQDPDTEIDDLMFELMELPKYGSLQLRGLQLQYGDSFSRTDLFHGLVAYVNTGLEMDKDSFKLDISDGIHRVPLTFKVEVKSIDDEAPTLLTNEPGTLATYIEVIEGQSVIITSDDLQASDPDTDALMLTFLMRSAPTHGILKRSGQPTDRFTQQDITENLVEYQHTGGEIGKTEQNDTVGLILTDLSDDWVIGGNKINNIEIYVKIIPLDTVPPVVRIRGNLKVYESEKALLTTDILLVEDEDTDVDDITCTIIAQPTHGYVENVSPTPGSERPRTGIPITAFSISDVTSANINYVQSIHTGVEPRMDGLTIKCSDGSNFSPNVLLPIDIYPSNDETPEVFMREFVVLEGMNLIIDLPILNAIDKDVPEDILNFIITKSPQHGNIVQQQLTGTYPITRFTMDDITDGSTIVYEHDDSETKEDSFEFVVTDGKHNVSSKVKIMVLPVDDETPRLTINNGLEIEHAGDVKTITNHDLKAEDLDSNDETLQYIVRRSPTHGILQLLDHGRILNLTLGSNFSQSAIDQNKIQYVHTGNEGIRDLIKFDITDGLNPLIDRYFYVSVEGIDMVFPSVVNKGVELPEGGRVILSTDILGGTDLNTPDEELRFTVTRAPSRGHLEISDMPGVPITTFTQLDLAGNKISYIHTSNDEMKMDSFEFEVTDGYNPVLRTFRIALSDVDNKKPVLIFDKLYAKEGGNKLITPFELKVDDHDTDAEKVIFSVNQVPIHGIILFNNSRTAMSFSLADINENLITYQHDGTETTSDTFSFTVTDGTHSDFFVSPQLTYTTRKPQQMIIEIVPVDNGKPMMAVNRGSSSLSPMGGTHGSDKMGARLTNRILKADDRDSPVEDLRYELTSPPEHGYIINAGNGNGAVINWTQADIDRRHIEYILKSNTNATSDHFFFKINDKGGNELSNQLFNLNWAWISLENDSYVVNETDKTLQVTLKRRGYLGETCFVSITVENDTALVGEDVSAKYAKQVQFSPGQTKKTWYLRIHDDGRFEGPEQVKLKLINPIMAIIESPKVATLTILDTEDESTVYIPEAEYHTTENIGEVHVPVRRSGDVGDELMVICSTVQDTATGTQPNSIASYSDYISRPEDFRNVIRFDKNETEKPCKVMIIDDSLYEEDEKFTVVLSQPMGGRLGVQNLTTVVIATDKNDEPTFYFGNAEYTVDESDGFAEVKVWRTGTDLSNPSTITVRSRRSDPRSAEAGIDYIGVNKVINFAPGVALQTIKVIVLDDLGRPHLEGPETFELVLRLPEGAMLGEPSKAVITINDEESDSPIMEFKETEYEVFENDDKITAYIVRKGDITHASSVRCYTRQATARVMDDFDERPNTNASIVEFAPGEREQVCEVRLLGDDEFEEKEQFKLVLGSPLSELPGGARVGEKNIAIIEIRDKGDKPVIKFEETRYTVKEPVLKGDINKFEIAVVRRGDQSQTSVVRVHTKDSSAKAGRDYNGISKELVFKPNVTKQIVTIDILYDGLKEMQELFTVHLRGDRNMIAEVKKNKKAIVYIEDKDKLADVTFPSKPVVASLKDYDQTDVQPLPLPIQGYPVICITPCNAAHPDYSNTGSLCTKEGINDTQTRYRWRVSAPTGDDGVTSELRNVESNTFFTDTHGITLDSIYFGGGSRIQCGARAVNQAGDPGLEMLSLPNTISPSEGLCLPRVAQSIGAEPFNAKIRYTGPEDEDHPNKVRISVTIPHRDGMLPAISTQQLTNFELTLSPDAFRIAQHRCSNVLDVDEVPTEVGFITNKTRDVRVGQTEPYQYSEELRTKPTLRFYRNLDLEACMWNFETYYDMSELVQDCGGSITTDGQVRDLVQSFVSMEVPLFVSFVVYSPVARGGWLNFDLHSKLKLTFVYDTAKLWEDGIRSPEGVSLQASDSVARNKDGTRLYGSPSQFSNTQGYLYPTAMRVRDDGRLAVNFKSKARFRGQFVPGYPGSGLESMIMSPDHPELTFQLELLRSEPTFEHPEQLWEFVSDYAVKDYSGTYNVKLIPCTTTSDEEYDLPLQCNPREPVTFELPIRFQQVSDPVGTEFSLNTDFYLLRKRDVWLSNGENGFGEDSDTSFLLDDEVLGRVNVDPVQNLGSSFRLNIEKVFVCTGKDGYIPKYDPKNQEYGCVANTGNLMNSFKILDKDAPSSVQSEFHNVPFKARFAADDPEAIALVKQPGADGFSLDSKPLFQVDQGRQWFLHCIYTLNSNRIPHRGKRSDNGEHNGEHHAIMSSQDVFRHKRALNEKGLVDKANEGTNMARIKLDYVGDNTGAGTYDVGTNNHKKKFSSYIVPLLIALISLLVVTVIVAAIIITRRRKKAVPPPPPSPVNTVTIIKGAKCKVTYANNLNSDQTEV